MKILLANKFFHLNGGAETVFFQERDFLFEKGIDVIDFSMKDSRNFPSPYVDFFIPNINFQFHTKHHIVKKFQLACSFIHSAIAINNLNSLILREKPQVAHLHNIYHHLTPSIIHILKKYKIKVIVTLHDYKLICPGYLALRQSELCDICKDNSFWKPFVVNCQNSRIHGLLLSMEAYWHKWKKSYEQVDFFLCPSRFLANLVSNRITSRKIKILHNGVDTKRYQANFSDRGYAFYFGRLSNEKGVVTLLEAHKQLKEKIPLKIAGTGPLKQKLQEKYPYIEFLGHQNHHDLHKIIANSAFVVVPSEWYENCSMVVLEAMAFGKAIIGSRIGGIPEQIQDNKTGLLFTPKNTTELTEKMGLLFNNIQLRKQMGYAARKKLEKEYALADHNYRLLELYSTLQKK